MKYPPFRGFILTYAYCKIVFWLVTRGMGKVRDVIAEIVEDINNFLNYLKIYIAKLVLQAKYSKV